jgi:hypothetical protein
MARHFPFTIDRSAKVTLAEQIRKGIADAIDNGLLTVRTVPRAAPS